MIRTKTDLAYYLGCDAIASKKPNPLEKNKGPRKSLARRIVGAYVQNRNLPWEYLVTLRTLEYIGRSSYGKITWKNAYRKLIKYKYQRRMLQLRRQTNIIVDSHQIGPGAYIPYHNVVVTPLAAIGNNCMIESNVVIGISNGIMKGPKIGNNVFIGTGAVIIGDIEIADGVCIGANAVVTKSVTQPYCTVAGVPARVISDKGSRGYLVEATEVWAQAQKERKKK